MDAARLGVHDDRMDRAAVSSSSIADAPIEMFGMVRVTEPVRGIDRAWPAGSVGTVVDIYKDGEGYAVEFTHPSDVAIVHARQLTPA